MRLTTPQQNIWNLQKFYEGTAIGNICGAIEYQEALDPEIAQQAIRHLVFTHDALRLEFSEDRGIPEQRIVSMPATEAIQIMHFDSKREFEHYAEHIAKLPFDLLRRCLYKFVISFFGNETAILICLHHLIADAWTVNLLANHFDKTYREIIHSGAVPDFQAPSYTDILCSEEKYRNSPRYDKDRDFWEKRYQNAPSIAQIKLHGDSITPATSQVTEEVAVELSKKIRQYADENHLTPALLFEAAMMFYLSRINADAQNVTIGLMVLNRATIAEKQTAGMGVATIPFTVSVDQNAPIKEVLQALKLERSSIYRHQRYPYSDILQLVREQHEGINSLYDVLVSFQNATTGINASTEWFSNGIMENSLQLHIDQRDGIDAYRVTITYLVDLFPQKQEIHLLISRILCIIRAIVEETADTVGVIPIITYAEQDTLLNRFNDTHVDYDHEKTVHELFAIQVAKTPDRVALVFEGQSFTYRQIDEMSNALAHELLRKGVSRNTIVPIISKRSWHVIAAMLGILKAGGAFICVDPTYPKERIQHILSIINCHVSLTYKYNDYVNSNTIDLEVFDFQKEPLEERILTQNDPDDLCYAIFTSGSTGIPKGIQITHHNINNFASNNPYNVCERIIKPNHSSILCLSNFTFDMCITETLLPLLNGVTILLADDEECNSPSLLAEHFMQTPVDIIESTPTKLALFLNSSKGLEYIRKAKVIIVGGEALSESFYEHLTDTASLLLYNNYGPAECTVWTTIKQQNHLPITIGKPIANTQIYILNDDHKPLPIGVAGELCIAGDSVGKGYLNQPELTAEKFIPNPFATKENGHGKIMYRTGDLARWRADGEIEYLGRIDTQVKIHGLRIELGEIESVMATYPGIQLTAATDKRDEGGRQYLVGYYTSNSTIIDEKDLREYLTSKLPKYMVPNYFVHLDAIPMTTSGKTDRKRLPPPSRQSVQVTYIAPQSTQEITLCRILSDILDLERIGIEDDFFSIGGDSLNAIVYSSRASEEGYSFTIQDVYNHPTVKSLCAWMNRDEANVVTYIPSDCEIYAHLLAQNQINSCFRAEKKSLGDVFLTGVTGFLGAHILDEFLRSEPGVVYCLVRGNSQREAEARLRERLSWYFGNQYDLEIGKRIRVIQGDITKDDLSDSLPTRIDTVIHTAATVKHFGSYDDFNQLNTLGTWRVVNFAKTVHARMIHISTVSVSGNGLADDFSVYHSPEEKHFDETCFYIGQPLDNVYIRSKFEAERHVFDYILHGGNGIIIRVGNLTNRVSDFCFQPNYKENAFLTRVKAALEFGMLPDYLLPLYAEFSPVDKTAEGILKIAQYAEGQTVFHLNSDKPIHFSRLLELFKNMGIRLEIVDGKRFSQALKDTMRDKKTEYIYEAFRRDMDENGNLLYDSNIHVENEFTSWFLHQTGFEWNEIDKRYIHGYIDYFEKNGYFCIDREDLSNE